MTEQSSSPGPAPEIGDILLADPHDLAVNGGSVARINGFTVFLDRGMPGDTVRCRIIGKKKRFATAEVLEIATPSPHTRPSFCPHGRVCGGCAWTTLDYKAELAWKERQVRETLARIGKVRFVDSGSFPQADQAEYLPIVASPRDLGYRNKVELAFGLTADGTPEVGFRQRGSHAVVPVEDCPLAARPLAPLLVTVREWMRSTGLPVQVENTGILRHLVVRLPDYAPDGAPRCLVEVITFPVEALPKKQITGLGRLLLDTGLATGFVHSVRKDRANVAYGEGVAATAGEATTVERFGNVLLEAPVQAFMQVNTPAASLLYDAVRTMAETALAGITDPLVWDLYCGVGGLACSLAAPGRMVRGIESVAEAVEYATRNAAVLPGGPDISFIHGDAGAVLDKNAASPDLVIADPPRSGLDGGCLQSLLRVRPRHIIAVSCDAGSLARDLAQLASSYEVLTVRTVDMFPRTPHMETVAHLRLREGDTAGLSSGTASAIATERSKP